MYITYVDESGHCGTKYNEKQPVEVLCGVITDVTKVFKTQREQSRLIRILKDNDLNINEIKATDIYSGRNSFKDVDANVRKLIIEAILALVEERFCKFIICPINSKKFFELKDNNNKIALALETPYVAGVIHILLSIQNYQKAKKNNKGKTFVICDEQHGSDNLILRVIKDYRHFFKGYCSFNNHIFDSIIDVPFFSKSHMVKLIQLADIVAFIFFKYLCLQKYDFDEKFEGEKRLIEKWYNMITPLMIPKNNILPKNNSEIVRFYKSICDLSS